MYIRSISFARIHIYHFLFVWFRAFTSSRFLAHAKCNCWPIWWCVSVWCVQRIERAKLLLLILSEKGTTNNKILNFIYSWACVRAAPPLQHVQNREYLAEKMQLPKKNSNEYIHASDENNPEGTQLNATRKEIAYLLACSTCIVLQQCEYLARRCFVVYQIFRLK